MSQQIEYASRNTRFLSDRDWWGRGLLCFGITIIAAGTAHHLRSERSTVEADSAHHYWHSILFEGNTFQVDHPGADIIFCTVNPGVSPYSYRISRMDADTETDALRSYASSLMGRQAASLSKEQVEEWRLITGNDFTPDQADSRNWDPWTAPYPPHPNLYKQLLNLRTHDALESGNAPTPRQQEAEAQQRYKLRVSNFWPYHWPSVSRLCLYPLALLFILFFHRKPRAQSATGIPRVL